MGEEAAESSLALLAAAREQLLHWHVLLVLVVLLVLLAPPVLLVLLPSLALGNHGKLLETERLEEDQVEEASGAALAREPPAERDQIRASSEQRTEA